MNQTRSADIVVAGAGHNALIAAAYLARAGKSVLVVDARPIPGGGVATEEYLPGYFMDSCSTGHTIIQGNPVIKDDTLGLVRDHGLEYVDPDPVARVALPDGEQIGMHLDPAATHAEFARFSDRDADRVPRVPRRLGAGKGRLLEGQQHAHRLGSVTGPTSRRPPQRRRLAPSSRAQRLGRHPARVHGGAHPGIPALGGVPDLRVGRPPGSGVMPYSIMGGRQQRSWTIPLGGSGRLTDALVAVIEEHGGADRLRHRRVATPAGRRPVRRRGVDRRTAVPGHRGGPVHDPRQAPDRHGTRGRVGRLLHLRGRDVRHRHPALRLLPRHERGADLPRTASRRHGGEQRTRPVAAGRHRPGAGRSATASR